MLSGGVCTAANLQTAGPLIGPTIAAQFGFAPGFLWLLIGAVLAGCVQDFLVLAASVVGALTLSRADKEEKSQ